MKQEVLRLKSKMYSFLVDNSKHKKAKGVKRNIIAKIIHNDVLLNNKCIRHSMNRTQNKDHKIGTYEIKKISLSYLVKMVKMVIQNKEHDGLAFGYQS